MVGGEGYAYLTSIMIGQNSYANAQFVQPREERTILSRAEEELQQLSACPVPCWTMRPRTIFGADVDLRVADGDYTIQSFGCFDRPLRCWS